MLQPLEEIFNRIQKLNPTEQMWCASKILVLINELESYRINQDENSTPNFRIAMKNDLEVLRNLNAKKQINSDELASWREDTRY